MTRARHVLVACVAIAVTVAATAAADPTTHPRPKPKDAAEAAYLEGRRHYDLREWDDAIESFKESYRLREDERSLFNIAQAYRLKGDCVEAMGFYQTYKRNFPDADGNTAVDKLIEDIGPCVRARQAAPPPPPPVEHPVVKVETPPVVETPPPPPPVVETPPPPPPVVETPPPPPPPQRRLKPPEPPIAPPPVEVVAHPGHRLRVTGVTLAVLGVAAIGGGSYFGLEARSKAQQVGTGTGTFNHQLESDGQDANRNAEILFAAGGVLALTGTVLYIVGRPSHLEHVAIAPTATGGTVAWRGSF